MTNLSSPVGVGFIRPGKNDNLPCRKNIRLKHYDYSADGYYFVTICAYDGKPHIGKYKEIVDRILLSLPNRFSGLTIDYYVLMPTHIHVIFIFNALKGELGDVVRIFKALVTRETKEKHFWQRNYYEHVIRNEKALLKIRQYIKNNPSAWKIEFGKFY